MKKAVLIVVPVLLALVVALGYLLGGIAARITGQSQNDSDLANSAPKVAPIAAPVELETGTLSIGAPIAKPITPSAGLTPSAQTSLAPASQ
jgi:hypothetical protein